jgi:CheY-like chemotaxis protein
MAKIIKNLVGEEALAVKERPSASTRNASFSKEPMSATILVVDDLKDNVVLLKTLLEHNGYNVLSAISGEEAVRLAREAMPDLILMDVMMAGMDGITACSILTNDERTKSIPVIMITAKSEPDDLKRGLEAGASDYVRKPFVLAELLARVSNALRFKEVQEKLVEQQKKIAIMELAGAAAHELNQPLTVINCQIKLLEEALEEKKIKPGREIEIIHESVNRMTEIIRKIGNITKYKTKDYLLGERIIDLDKASEDQENE